MCPWKQGLEGRSLLGDEPGEGGDCWGKSLLGEEPLGGEGRGLEGEEPARGGASGGRPWEEQVKGMFCRVGRAPAPGEGAVQEAAVAQQASPKLDTHDAEDEEDKEAEQEDVPEHGQRVQQQRDQDPHACRWQGSRSVQRSPPGNP